MAVITASPGCCAAARPGPAIVIASCDELRHSACSDTSRSPPPADFAIRR
jgi:hypothetical protein